MTLEQRIKTFVTLGTFLGHFPVGNIEEITQEERSYYEAMQMLIDRAKESNGWFTKENIYKAFRSWANALTEENLNQWTNSASFDASPQKTVAIIMAGNIPLVGFHDFLSVLISGHKAQIKLSSNDNKFLPIIAKYLAFLDPYYKEAITFSTGNLTAFDAVIATGSNNTARYFDHYFSKYPNIIRKSRNSVAVLTGEESMEDLENLGEDIFRYYGLGCRSVSKLFVPKDYDFTDFFAAMFSFKEVIYGNKYQNNYDYNKAVYLMSLFKLQENGFLMLKEDANYGSPIATLFFEHYDTLESVSTKLQEDKDKIQCVVSSSNTLANTIPFGKSQEPELWDYADGINTLEFLEKLT